MGRAVAWYLLRYTLNERYRFPSFSVRSTWYAVYVHHLPTTCDFHRFN